MFPLDGCNRVALIDEATGAPIVGAEDFDIDRESGRIFISAYDRRGAEAAASGRAAAVPEGGIYAIDIAQLRGEEIAIPLRSLIDASQIEGGLRPHGVSFDRDSGVLSFINRSYMLDDGVWRRAPSVIAFRPDAPESIRQFRTACSANDLASINGALVTTLDHDGCGWRAALDDVFGLRSGRVVKDDGEDLVTGLGFANGVVATPGGSLAVAATRERSVHVFDFDADGVKNNAVIRLKGAPDNLTLSDDGRIVAAVHPQLMALGLQRKLGVGRSPSRVVEIDLATGAERLLFSDPDAELVAAATAAIFTEDLLVIGSVIDDGLVVCRSEAQSQ